MAGSLTYGCATVAICGTGGLQSRQDESGDDRSDDRAAITECVEEPVQMLDLKTVVQRVLETMCPVEQRQGTDAEYHEPRHRMQEDRAQPGVIEWRQPAHRNRDAEDHDQHGHDQRRRHPSSAEEKPESGLDAKT